jgi:lipoic acid synthetase
VLRVRWLGRVSYREALILQHSIWARSSDDHLLLVEHPHVYTLGVRADPAHVLVDPATVGADVVRADRGGDVTYHGPGQLVGYPILTLVEPARAMPDTPAYVQALEQTIIDVLADLGVAGAGRLRGYPGVWVDPSGPAPRKICAVGVRLSRGRSMHGFALNVDPDLTMFDHIVPCGIREHGVTSLAAEGVTVSMRRVVDAVVARAQARWGNPIAGGTERADVSWSAGQGHLMSVIGGTRKPEWLRVKANLGPQYRALRRTMRSLDLVTVCEEAGCPNIFECWGEGTATFMINGDRCTRACAFCQVDSGRPAPPSPEEPARVAEAVERMGLEHAVVTAVARDDLADGGAANFAATIRAIRARCPATTVEVLIPDCKGDANALEIIFEAGPDVLNHNLETVARLQRAVRPSAGYARSLALLSRAKDAGLTTKSGLILGMGETDAEVIGALADLRAVGVDIVTIGQYLRPTARHLPVDRWVSPETFADLQVAAAAMGFAHVEASPLTRSSYHAKRSAVGAGVRAADAG